MASATPGERRVQTHLGPHLLTDLLHETSTRAIYRAVQDGTEREVLLMVLTESLSADPRIRDGFGPQLRQAAGVLERHLVPLRRWGSIDGLLCAELGVLSGTGLRTLLADEPMAPGRAVDLVADLAAAIDAAHVRGVAHLGLSPTTVVVGEDDVARVIDLGLAALLVGAGVEPEPADRPYRAPELAGAPHPGAAAGVRADVFSLTALLWDALTGIGPAAREPLLSPSLVGLLQRGTGRPAERPHSGAELVRSARFALRDETEPMRLPLRPAPPLDGPTASPPATATTALPRPSSAPADASGSAGAVGSAGVAGPSRSAGPAQGSAASGAAASGAVASGRPAGGAPPSHPAWPHAVSPGPEGSQHAASSQPSGVTSAPASGGAAAPRAGRGASSAGSTGPGRSGARPVESDRSRRSLVIPVVATILVALALVAVAGLLWLLFDPPGRPAAQPATPATAPPTQPVDPTPAPAPPSADPSEPATTPTTTSPAATPTPSPTSTSPSATPDLERPVLPDSARVCVADADPRNGLTGSAVGSANTSCEFAEAARTVLADSGDPYAVTRAEVTSPVTEQDYTLSCSSSDESPGASRLITCTGGNNAVVLVW